MDPLFAWYDSAFGSWGRIVLLLLGAIGFIAVLMYFLKRLRAFGSDQGRRLVDWFFWKISRLAGQAMRARLSMRAYCRVRLGDRRVRSLQVPGARDTSLNVDEVYVPLTLESGGHGRSYTSANLLDAGNRLLIIGDPGSGKSTLVKKVFRDACRRTSEKPSKGRLPVLRDLKDLSPPAHLTREEDLGEWLLDDLRTQVGKVEGFEMLELFDTWVSGPGLLLLFDGMDEVASNRYVQVAAALRGLGQRLSEKSPNNAVTVTMRVQFYQQVRTDLLEDYPQTLYVRPFAPNEIFLFLRRWPFTRDQEKNANRVYRELTDRPTLRDLCGNPLVLAMYTQRDWEDDTGMIPASRTEPFRATVYDRG